MKKLLITFSLFLLSSIAAIAQLNQNFESGIIPSNWAIFNNGIGTNTWTTSSNATTSCNGTAAYMNARGDIGAGNTSENWMVTNLVSIPANGELKFISRTGFVGNNNAVFRIKVSTSSQTNINAFSSVQEWEDYRLNSVYNSCEEKTVDLSSYAGQNVYIAFVVSVMQPTIGLTGNRWIVDNIRLVQQCRTPTAIDMVDFAPNQILLNWNDSNNSSQWEIEVIESNQVPSGSGVVVSSNQYLATNLVPGIHYKCYVRSLCASNNFSAWSSPFYIASGCGSPRNVVLDFGGNNVTVSWDSGMNSQWEVEIAPLNQNYTNSGVVVNSNSHTFNNIDPNKIYKVQVRSICVANNQTYTSGWVNKSCVSGGISAFQITNNPGNKDLCANEVISFTAEMNEVINYYWRIYDSNDNMVATFDVANPTFVFSQPGNYYCTLEVSTAKCNDMFRFEFKIDDCGKKCFSGKITTTNGICQGNKNYFSFSPDSSTPIDYSDPTLHFEWHVTDSSGNPVPFEPVYLFGSSLAYYIIIPFEGPGEYTVDLSVSNSKCKERFEKIVRLEKDCACKPARGDIKIKQEKLCAGSKIDFYFSEPQQGYTYTWNILNNQYQNIYSSTGTVAGVTTIINQPGEYTVVLTIKDEKGCETLFVVTIKVENCGDRCLFGEIKNNSILCAGGKNFFWFVPDPSTPIDYSDQGLHFEWSVTDVNGNQVSFQPVSLFGSSLAYYIIVPFDADGEYTVSVHVVGSKCKEKIEKTVTVSKECACPTIKGEIRIKQEKLCAGQKIDLYFSDAQQGYTYSWNILNSQYQSVYSSTGTTEGISPTLTEVGEYTVILIVKDTKGCETLFITTIKIQDCDTVNPDCFYHLAFSYATPNSGSPSINNAIRLDIAEGITDFVNQNITGKLFITSTDDHSTGSRFGAKQNIVTEAWNTPYINPSNEINGFNSVGNGLRVRIQDNDYANTATNLLNFIASAEAITIPIDVDFLIISRDSNTSEIASSYSNLLSSGKVKKIFFILFEGGQYSLNGQNLTAASFMNQVINGNAVNFSQTNSILNSNYVVIPASIHQTPNITNYIKVFLQNAYNEVKTKTVCNSNCLNGGISASTSLCAGTDNFFWFNPTSTINFTDPTLQFTWTVTSNGNPVAFESINANNTSINLTNPVAGNYTITLVIANSVCTKTIVKNVTIGRCTVASCGDSTNQYYVVGLFKELLKHLKSQPAGSITNGYSCPELIALLPYINPSIANPAIYNFSNANNTIRFSFSPNASSPHVVFAMPATNPNFFVALSLGNNYTNMNNPTSFVSSFFVFSPFFPILTPTTGSTVSQINFCPKQLNCINHIAIVLDESTSITSVDAGRIRGQLKKFIDQQVVFNQTKGSQLKISLIGLSDQDNNVRTDNIISMPVNPTNKQTLINWVNKYKTRYNEGLSGVSSNSDYWNSGLSRVAQTDASLVILITDGAQTGNATTLKNTIALYNNANATAQKHLYVIGLNNGYYIDSSTGSARYSEKSNPNLVEEKIAEDEDEAGFVNFENSPDSKRVTDFLRISLRALIYNNTQFPTESLHDFSKDYSGHTNFKFLYDDPFYLSNGLYKFLGESCGEEQYLERCDDCDGVQLDVKQSYIISAWVHVDKTQQVTSFKEANQSPSIEIHFCDEGDIDADDANPDNPNSQHLSDVTEGGIVYQGGVEFFPQGNIIDGWQRIFGVFKVHPETVYMKIILNNGSRSDAMHFDDIRIHPREGSMKSFVYDEQTYKLMSELDENNYSTYYEYDAEGGLVRVKKETERGVKTIQETRSGTIIKSE